MYARKRHCYCYHYCYYYEHALLAQRALQAANLKISQMEDSAQSAGQQGKAAFQDLQRLYQQVSQLQSALEKSKKSAENLTAEVGSTLDTLCLSHNFTFALGSVQQSLCFNRLCSC